jgi:hypothetical protein
MDPIYDDLTGCGVEGLARDRANKFAEVGATTVGVLSIIPAAVCGTSVTLVITGTITSTNTIVTGILAVCSPEQVSRLMLEWAWPLEACC